MAIDVNNLPPGVIPPEIAEAFGQFLNVEGRVKFPLKPTRTSAVSRSAEEDVGDTRDAEREVDDLIDSVDEMEDLVEQLEDLADQLIKDMNIPVDPDNTPLKKAVQRLGGDDAITQDVFENALGIIENAPDITFRQSPIVAGYTGDGHIDGPWLDCSQVTAAAADYFNLRGDNPGVPEDPVVPKNEEIFEDFDSNLADMILHIILMLWWNMIWPKFLVDLAIIDPLRLMIADPMDKLIGFFKFRPFRQKGKDWIRENGKINQALDKFRIFLLCAVPYKLWSTADKDYDPIVQVTCPAENDEECDDGQEPREGADKGDTDAKDFFADEDDEICASPSEYGENAPPDEAEGLGMSPDCLQAASRVVRAVEDASYSSRQNSQSDPTLQTNLRTAAEEQGLF